MTKQRPVSSGYATVIHISGLVGGFLNAILPSANIILPLVLWLFKKDDEFCDFHGREAVRFQICMFLYAVLMTLLLFVFMVAGGLVFDMSLVAQKMNELVSGGLIGLFLLFLPVILIFIILQIIFPVIAAVKAYKGKLWCYPLTFSPRRKSLKQGTTVQR